MHAVDRVSDNYLAMDPAFLLAWVMPQNNKSPQNMHDWNRQATDDINLFRLVLNGDTSACVKSIERGGNVNAKDFFGWTPLHYAARNGNLGLCRALLERGADVNAIEVDPSKGWQCHALHLAARNGHAGICLLLLKHGADAHAACMSGENALELAIKFKRMRCVNVIRTLMAIDCARDAVREMVDGNPSKAASP